MLPSTAVTAQLALKAAHGGQQRGENPVRGHQVSIWQVRERHPGMSRQRPEIRPGGRSTGFGMTQHYLSAIAWVRVTAKVTRIDQPVHQVGDGRTGHAHHVAEVTRGHRAPGGFRHHDVQQRTEIVGPQIM